MMWPRSPAATILSPARSASFRSFSGARIVGLDGISIISAIAKTEGAAIAIDRPKQAAPRVLHINLLAIQIAYCVVLNKIIPD
jgi:hypothetical protein